MLGLKDLSVQCHVQASCAVTGEGLEEALLCLQDMIVRRRRLGHVADMAKARVATSATATAGMANGHKAGRRVRRSHSHHF
jgi:hypothetical protein